METIMTIGFASKDPAYGGCFSMWLLITLQALSGVFAQSVLFGFVFARLSRADAPWRPSAGSARRGAGRCRRSP